jgi:tRNA (cytidine/uridine-2'-O-)-methyltransferase
VLVEPEIPQNTGNVARTCALTGSVLHLVRPLGFSLEDRYLRRAGLDYWGQVEVKVWDSFAELQQALAPAAGRTHLATTRAQRLYTEVRYGPHDVLVFGRETTGLPAALLEAHPECTVRIPMRPLGRSLNLSNAVAVVLYEALRQNGFPGLA